MIKLLVVALCCLGAANASQQETTAASSKDKVEVPFHGNAKCPISGNAIDKKKSLSHEGQSVYFCCGNCLAKGKEDPAAMVSAAYAKVTKVGNTVCPLAGKEIAEGKGKTVTFQGKEVRVCCGNCAKSFTKAPNLNVTKAENPKLVSLKNENCPVMGKPVKPDMFVVYKGKIINICCPGCDTKLQKDPKPLDKIVDEG